MIDEDETFCVMGYYSTELSRGSHKKVWAICEGVECERNGGRGRWVEFKAYRDLCHCCASKKRRTLCYDHCNMRSIDEEKTFADNGYCSTDLSVQSHKNVWAICTVCGFGRWLEFKKYRDMCHKCAMRTEEHRVIISELRNGTKMPPRTEEHRQHISAGQQGISYDEWEGFATDQPYCPMFDETCRESNRDKYDRKCFVCGLDESENVASTNKHRKLSVHHVDMNKDQGCNEHRWKLVPLCMVCHGMAHNIIVMSRIEYLLKCVWNKE